MIPLTVLTCLALCVTGCGHSNNNSATTNDTLEIKKIPIKNNFSVLPDSTRNIQVQDKYYPFELQDFNDQYSIIANIESEDLFEKYYTFFKQRGYIGNGYCWEGHIRQILENLDKSLLSKIDFDAEAGSFFAIADSRESQLKFVEILSPIFSDLKKLEGWVNKADRTRIDD